MSLLSPFSQTLFKNGVYATILLCGIYGGYYIGTFDLHRSKSEQLDHPLCYDTKRQSAWIAKKNGELRCFLEGKEYPHRVKAANIDYETPPGR